MHFGFAQCKQKGFGGIIILVILLILAGLGGAYYFDKSQASKLQSQLRNSPTSSSPFVSGMVKVLINY